MVPWKHILQDASHRFLCRDVIHTVMFCNLAFDNKALGIFTPKTEEVIGLGKLHCGELYNYFSLLNIIQQKTWKMHGEACSTHGEDESFITNLCIKV